MTVIPADADLYLDLLKKVVTNMIYEDQTNVAGLITSSSYSAELRAVGEDFPHVAHTMVGLKRLDNLQKCLEDVLRNGVPGDFAETGVWRGGACIFARGVFQAHGVRDRKVWVADSFQGFPKTTEDDHQLDVDIDLGQYNEVLSIPVDVETVKRNFARYGLLDDQVRFLPGWFKDTMPTAPIEKLAVLRLDGDSYAATREVLTSLYHKVSVGGYVIVDDYCIPACRQAVHEFRDEHGITDEIHQIDRQGSYWRRSS
ncbi:TylF/MycF family methyltransferase [Streptomyces goshikiensis]|uniref:TylF/MycF family methyltransferase n=1 Tax=Streptomyces TaxID=1883 RepID=UPI001F3AA6B1|nr:TylF/MycF family methyltransferase [Streptomyces sp. CB02120-2]